MTREKVGENFRYNGCAIIFVSPKGSGVVDPEYEPYRDCQKHNGTTYFDLFLFFFTLSRGALLLHAELIEKRRLLSFLTSIIWTI